MQKLYLTPETLPDWSDYFSQIGVQALADKKFKVEVDVEAITAYNDALQLRLNS